MINIKAYIDGEFFTSEEKVEVVSPLDLKTVGTYPALKKDKIDKAFAAAKHSFKTWKRIGSEQRIKIIKRFKTILNANKQDLASIMHLENGKDIKAGISEIERTIEYINKTIEAYEVIKLKKVIINQKTSYQYQVPLGVVLAISPFNYPVNLSLAKIIPALIAGNTVVFKAATNGSLVGGKIAEYFDEANMPVGVFNYVTGRGRDIGDYLTTHRDIDMVSFTGSVEIGKRIAKHMAMKPYVLELGGNDAAYIRYDADIDLAIGEIVGGGFGYSGQRCTAIKRVILHEKVASIIIPELIRQIKDIKIGPVIDLKTAKFIKNLYDESKQSGDKILVDGIFDKNYITPILIQTTHDSSLWRNEPFGPILPIIVVGSDQEAIEIMNDTNFGLQNSLFSKDRDWAKKIALNIESGTVNINRMSSRGPDEFPFSGIKDSGFGVQGIDSALYSMTRVLNIVDNE